MNGIKPNNPKICSIIKNKLKDFAPITLPSSVASDGLQ
jgi:hypothetical protein